jgi:hypothetical protein
MNDRDKARAVLNELMGDAKLVEGDAVEDALGTVAIVETWAVATGETEDGDTVALAFPRSELQTLGFTPDDAVRAGIALVLAGKAAGADADIVEVRGHRERPGGNGGPMMRMDI